MAFEPGQLGRISAGAAAPQREPTEKQAQEQVEREKTAREKEVLEEERIYRRGVVSIKDIIAPAGIQVESGHLKLGETFVRTIFVVAYPRYISLGWFAPIINMNTTLDVSMFFYPIKSGIILKQLKKKVGMLEAQIISDRDKGAPRDPIRETALRDIEELRDSLSQGTEHFFQFALYVTLYAKNKEELDKLSEDVENLFGGKLIFTKRVFYQAEQGFNSTLPLGNDELMISFNMNSS
ncbi:conjugal transfer protein TraC, partial [Patescibacteria group bacterium]|nr:conjugal transfer protein TraC [Patescibacteria group bacterium]